MKVNAGFVRMVVVCIGVAILLSCSTEKDMRQGLVETLGEPDIIDKGGSGPYQYEYYWYLNQNVDRMYVFQKSAPGCGSSGNWYVEYVYRASYQASYYGYELYEPPTINHAQLVTAPVGKQIVVRAEITDDERVVSADLFYRVRGTADSTAVRMAVVDSLYTAEIPALAVTEAGVEYFIEASDGDHTSKLPPRGYFTILTTKSKTAETYAEPETTFRPIAPIDVPVGSSGHDSSVNP